jgi:hypothetical protein
MQHFPLKQLLLVIICCTSISVAYADSVAVTESVSESLKSSKTDGVTTYSVESSGKFSVTAKISGYSFYDVGILLTDITKDSTIAVSIGSYAFSSTLSAADKNKYTLTSTKIAGKWSKTHQECGGRASNICKDVTDTTVSITGGLAGIVLKIDGKSNDPDLASPYGSRIFAETCRSAGDGAVLSEDATLTVNGIPLTATLTGKCSVKTRPVVKGGETFDITTTKLTAKY